MKIIQRLNDSWEFLVNCIKFLNNNPGIIIFPLLSLVVTITVVASFAYASIVNLALIKQIAQDKIWLLIAVLIIGYFILSFIVLYRLYEKMSG